MLRFFRTIRLRLLDSGSLRKYFVYAIGEILLVMIGILLALQVNNWNQNLKAKQLEKQYLLNLKTEFELNLEELERVKNHRRTVIRDLESLMALCGTKVPDISNDSINRLLDNTVFVYITYFFNASTPVLEEIKSSGNLVNISNSKLRFYLNTWESKISYLQGSEKEYLDYRNELLQLIRKQGAMKEIAQMNPFFQKLDGLNFSTTNKAILQIPEAGNLLFLMYADTLVFEKIAYSIVKEHIDNILSLIKEELN